MSTRGTSTRGIVEATGIPWETWTARLDALGARRMGHTQIARHLTEQLTGVVANPEWWAQSVTVAYEQHIGARRPGQAGDGRFNVSAGRTVDGAADDLLARWGALMAGDPGVACADPPSTSATEKWRYWRARLADGSRVSVNITTKGAGRCTVAVAHAGLASPEDVEPWRAFWKERLRGL
jgi:hypothetical protein